MNIHRSTEIRSQVLTTTDGPRGAAATDRTLLGMNLYGRAFTQDYDHVVDQVAQVLVGGKLNGSREVATELEKPELLIEHAMEILEHNGYIRTVSDSGGVHVMELLPKLRRQLNAG